MPILFPVNRISNGEFEFEKRKYKFPINDPNTKSHIHGFLHKAEFNLIDQSDNFVKCIYLSDNLYDFFPHKFAVEITYLLSKKGLIQEIYIYNLSNTNMPIFLGLHTTFNIPFIKDSLGENIRVFSGLEYEIERNSNYVPTGRILPHDEIFYQLNNGEFIPFGNKISKHFRANKNGKIEIRDIYKKIKVVYDVDKQFSWRLFYNGDANSFICLEPQTCIVDCPNTVFDRNDVGFDYIKPTSHKKYTSQIYIEKF